MSDIPPNLSWPDAESNTEPKANTPPKRKAKKKPRSKPLQNKKRKLQKFKGVPIARGKKPKKYK